tara:strand:- start:206 stop:805 length:600 start_codon:yes stop_codon:yes gene_type:complete
MSSLGSNKGLLTFAGILALGIGLEAYRRRQGGTDALGGKDDEGYVSPPLPQEVVTLLNASRLCHMATQSEDLEPHLSLMNFSYYQTDEVIIMCTSRKTTKYQQILNVPNVAILIHDFPHLNVDKDISLAGRSFSITLKGKAAVMDEGGEGEKKYRKIHMERNPDYAQFSKTGAVIVVRVEKVRLCDVQDNVTTWEAPRK